VGREQSSKYLQQGGLASAVRPHDANPASRADFQRYVAEHDLAATLEREVSDGEYGAVGV
jgi:hypothetical protein